MRAQQKNLRSHNDNELFAFLQTCVIDGGKISQ